MRHPPTRTGSEPRRGVVLLAVLVVVVLLTLAAYQFSELMMAEYKAASSYTRAAQARAFADSGINYAAMLLSDPELFANTLGGNPYDNPDLFSAVAVGAGGLRQGYFSVVSPLGPDDTPGSQPFRYGAADEAAKINLNGLLRVDRSGSFAVRVLTTLGIPEDTANAIVDWIDTDDTPRANGAESETYSVLGYRAKNGPLDTLEELLFVRGVTPELLFGNDRNRNGVIDPDEQAGGVLRDLGWSAYLTVYSREQNVDGEGNPRIYVNDTNTEQLYNKLTEAVGAELANYIIAYRAYSQSSSGSGGQQGGSSPQSGSSQQGGNRSGQQQPQQNSQSGQQSQGGQDSAPAPVTKSAADLSRDELQLGSRSRGRRLSSIFELINSEVTIPARNQGQPATRVVSPLNDPQTLYEMLPLLFDKVTTSRDQDLPARVNINTAPRQVLLALPAGTDGAGLTETEVETILSSRPNPSAITAPDPIFETPAWLYTEANLTVDKLRTLERFITSRTQVYRLQVVGHFAQGGPSMRVEAIVDTNRGRPRVVYWRDLSELGRGFALPGVNVP